MAESVVLTKIANGDFQIEVTGQYLYTKQFQAAMYSTTELGVQLHVELGPMIMFKHYSPDEWTIDGVSGFTTNTEVATALTGLNIGKLISTDAEGNILYPSGLPARLTATLTRPADTANYTAGDAINTHTVSVKKKVTVTLSGTSGTANVTVGGVTKLATFATDLTTTAANFVTAWAADYLAAGIVLTSSGADLIFEAQTAGVDFATGSTANVTTNLAGSHVVTTANVTLVPITLSNAAINNGGGGFIMDFNVESSAVQFAEKTIRVWLFNDTPSGIVGDNVAYVNSFANADKRMACAYFDCTFDALLAGSDTVIGKCQPNAEYVCAATSKNMYALIQTTSAITSPASAGVFKFYFNVLKVN